jgi:hypothetical protein
MPFELRIHTQPRVIEVVYPAQPSALEIGDYVARLRKAIDEQGGPWRGLVDQRNLQNLGADLLGALKVTNHYAAGHGMIRLARLVPDAIGTLSAWRVGNEAKLKIPVEIFQSRDEAWSWITAD